MFNEEQVWAEAQAAPGVVMNTLMQFVNAPAVRPTAYTERASCVARNGEWYRRRLIKWQKVFAELGNVRVSTSQIAKHLGRTNVSILNDLYKLEDRDQIIVRDGSTPHPKTRKPITRWTWTGDKSC